MIKDWGERENREEVKLDMHELDVEVPPRRLSKEQLPLETLVTKTYRRVSRIEMRLV